MKQPKRINAHVYDFTEIENGEYSLIITNGEITILEDEDAYPLIRIVEE